MKIMGIMFIASGVAMLGASLAGFRPELWRFEYFVYSNIWSVVAGGTFYLCGHLKYKNPESATKYNLLGILVFILTGVVASLLFRAGAPTNI